MNAETAAPEKIDSIFEIKEYQGTSQLAFLRRP